MMQRPVAVVCLIACALLASSWALAKREAKMAQALGVKIDVDDPEYGKAVITNESLKSLKNVKGTVREDYSYLDGGFITHFFSLDKLAPGERHVIPLVYVKDDIDIGRLDVWLECNRGKSHYRGEWSYAMGANILEPLLFLRKNHRRKPVDE